MSEEGVFDATQGLEESTAKNPLTAGAMMRQAREASGLHVAALAVSMKIPVKKLEALEADRLDLLHDAVFMRALAASVCRTLKIDPAPILGKLPQSPAPKLTSAESGVNAPFRTAGYGKGISVPESLKKPSSLAFVALVLAGIAVFFLPNATVPSFSDEMANQANTVPDNVNTLLGTEPPLSEPIVNSESVAISSVAPQVAAEGAITKDGASAQMNTAVAPVVAASQISPLTTSVQSNATALSQSSSLPSVAASSPVIAPALPTTGTVVFKAKGETWVKVVDSKGFVQLSKTLANGDVVGASGALPLSVVIGRVDATDVEVRGQAFNLTSVSRDNVARFEVK